jgi:very-short-patch-repair endonuclease
MPEPKAPHDRLIFRREQRSAPSRIERILWECLRDRRFHGLKFRRQHSIGPYVADFYCDALQLVVEADGRVHEQPESRLHDAVRNTWMTSRGLIVVRLPEDEIINATSLALKRIEKAIGKA